MNTSALKAEEKHNQALLESALFLASRSIAVAPVCVHHTGWCRCKNGRECEHPGKVPQLVHGYNDASTDTEIIRDWWTHRYKGHNVGIAVGREHGILVIECDVRHGGDLNLERFLETYGSFPETLVVGSGSGGRHYYFRYPDSEQDMPSGHFDHLGLPYEGLEVKSKGGMVAPPSIHLSGNHYAYLSFPDAPIAHMPEWLYLLLAPQPEEEQNQQQIVISSGVLFSDIETREIRWLWKDRIPLGKVSILDGDPDLGKSLLTIDIGARVSRGNLMPDGSLTVQGGIIVISLEDDASDTIKPRLEAAGADLTKCLDLSTVRYLNKETKEIDDYPFSIPRDLPMLEREIYRIEAVLVIIDPLMAVLDPKLKARDDQDVRQALTPLARLAERTGTAIWMVRHLNKGNSDNALLRGAGSMGIIGAARSGMIVTEDPDDAERRVLARTKNNLSKKADNLVYSILENQSKQPYIKWLGTSTHSTAELLTTTKPSQGRQAILHVLKDATEPLGPRTIAERTGLNYDQVRQLLKRMVVDGSIISPARGIYTLSQSSQSSQASDTNNDKWNDECDSDCGAEGECHNAERASNGIAATNVTVVTPVRVVREL